MRKSFWTLSLLSILLAIPLLAAGNDDVMWINIINPSLAVEHDTNYAADHIDVIDLQTRKVVHTITGIPNPSDRTFSPDGSRAYVSSVTTEHNLYVVDTKAGKVIGKVLLSGRPNRPSISKDGKRVYVAIRDPGPPVKIADSDVNGLDFNFDNKYRWAKNGGAVDVVDTTTLKLIKTIPTTGPLHNCYVTPDDKYVACDSPEAHNVAVVDTQTGTLAWETAVEGPPGPSKIFRHGDPQSMSVEAGPDGSTNRITVEIRGLRGFAVIDFAARKQVGIVQFPDQPNGFISNADEPHTHGDVVSPDGKTRWVASQDSNAYFIYSLPDLKLVGHVSHPEFKASEHPDFKTAGHLNSAIGCNTGEFEFTDGGTKVWAECSPGFGIPDFLYAVDAKTLKLLDDRIALNKAARSGDPRALSVIDKKK
jgi:dipeptidyl aminopeptidase/acylaminoacyl peptidase